MEREREVEQLLKEFIDKNKNFFDAPFLTKIFNGIPTLENFQKYDAYPEMLLRNNMDTDALWEKLLKEFDQEEIKNNILSGARRMTENADERIERVNSLLKCSNAFLFLNVGSFHTGVYGSDNTCNLLKERLKDENFYFIVTSPHKIMKKDGQNKFAEMLINSNKGLVFDIGERIPLHFMSAITPSLSKKQCFFTFEKKHNEEQIIRKRIILSSPKNICKLYAAQFKIILKKGKLIKSISEFGSM